MSGPDGEKGSMDAESIRVRSAKPTVEDGLRFAHFAEMASKGQYRLLLGRRATEILATAFSKPNHDLSYEHTVFAECDGEVLGMTSGYTARQHRRASDKPLKQVAEHSALRMAVTFFVASPVLRFLHTYADGDFYVQFLAVDERHREKGIGSRLLRALEDRARDSASTRLVIDVVNRNVVARRLYRHYGFTPIDRWPRTRLVRPTLLRMVKPL